MTKKLTLPNDIFLGEVEELLRQGQPVRLKPRGRSMEPFIREESDEVILNKPGQLKVGQIVMAHLTEGNHVLHRIVKIQGNTIILMGDGNLQGVESSSKEQVYGLVTKIIRNGKVINCQSRCAQLNSLIWRKTRLIRKVELGVHRLFFRKSGKKTLQ